MAEALRVLYVDDDPALLEVSKMFLEEEGGFRVTTLTSASEALERMKMEWYDAIVSDYQMPEMDGIQFLLEERARFGPVPFIIFTGRGREEIAIQAFENGADFYIRKGDEPLSQFTDLRLRIREAIDHRRSDREVALLTRLNTMLSSTTKAIERIHDKSELLNEICRIAVDIGGFRMAWVGQVNRKRHFIKPIASYGSVDGFLDSVAISTDDCFQGRGPTGTAYRTGTVNACNDVVIDPRMAPWREAALERGYNSIAAFPIGLDTKTPCVITLYASEPGFFTGPVIQLLDVLPSHLSLAFSTIEQKEQRIALENDLKRSELQYRHLFETVQEAVLILDGDTGEVIDANKFLCYMLGYSRSCFVGKHLWELGFFRDKVISEDAFFGLKTNGYLRYEGIPVETKDGQRMEVDFVSNAYRAGDKKIIQCNLRHISRRKRVEEQLERSEEWFGGIFDAINDGVHIHEIELDGKPGKFIAVNEAACRMLGYSREELLKHGPFDFVTGYHSRPVEDIIVELFSTGQAVFGTRHRRKDGTIVPVEINARIVNLNRERIVVSVVRDTSPRKLAEKST